jgi:hypothetical protein
MERIPGRRPDWGPALVRLNAIPLLIWTIIENPAAILHIIRFLCFTFPRFVFNIVLTLSNYIMAQLGTFRRQYLNTQMTEPPAAPILTTPNTTSLRTPTMPENIFECLSTHLANEPWTIGRDIVVNKMSNTISVFEVSDHRNGNRTIITDEIPFTYRDVPVIPHCYPRLHSSPAPFDYSSNNALFDSLDEKDIRTLYQNLRGILSIDFYIDRQVYIALTREGWEEAYNKYPTMALSAFGCILILALAAPQEVPFKGFTEYSSTKSRKPIAPGVEVFNKLAEYSSIGVLLLLRGHGPQENLKDFTLSAHSFVRKRHIYDFNILSTFILTIIVYVAYTVATRQLYSLLFLKTWLFIRLYFLLWDALIKYYGKLLSIHRLVHPF